MSNFDIGTLLHFKPPRVVCEKCKALLYDLKVDYRKKTICCPICKVTYTPDATYSIGNTLEYLDSQDCGIVFKNPFKHGQELASIAHNFNRSSESYPPMRGLLEAIVCAEQFIHFTTYGLSHILFGALKLKAQSIKIRGIASNLHADFISEIESCKHEAPNLTMVAFSQNRTDNMVIPHQKLVVIDGLMAFMGSANMTNDGWRKAASGLDHIEIVTNIQKVVEHNNKLFSPIWAKFCDLSKDDSIDMNVMPW